MVANKKLAFDPADSHGRHIVFGWLEVGEVVKELPLRHDLSFLKYHPHVSFFEQEVKPNRIYVSSKSGLKAGLFSTESDGVVLTQEGGRRSQWLLDEAFESLFLERDLTYHGNEVRWDREDEKIRLQAVSRGQEFVFDGDRHPGAKNYFAERIRSALLSTPRPCSHDF